ncbi:MAG: T9SS type A sorting domain-containing protein [Bacteroidota bacterium]
MKRLLSAYFLWVVSITLATAQINYTAQDVVQPFDGPFGYGSNMGYFPPWEDEQLAEIAVGNNDLGIIGAGVKSLRPSLPEHFLEQWGYDVRINTFQFYQELGVENNTVFIGYPRNSHQDTSYFCPSHRSEVFANLYTDIWDGGANDTPVNDDNYYALYLYKMVTRYKDYVKFWEVWNEPDFDYSGNAWKPADIPGNWWVNNPDPCDYALRAPVFHYIRMLRISYEVIKTLDPDAYVTTGGFGFPSFLDAVLRNTDNPLNGLPSPDYPLKGGAYFDVLSFHAYPHIDGSLRDWSEEIEDFVYRRHSDAAADGVIIKKKEFEAVLKKHGYGLQYPAKPFIITESNIPRVAFGEFIGSDEAQRNFIIKALIEVQKNGIEQFCIFNLGDSRVQSEAISEFQLMGLYKNLSANGPYTQVSNDIAAAYRTTSDLLYGAQFDPIETQAMLLEDNIGGGAFVHPDGSYTYVLWTKTSTDLSELVTKSYSFPPLIATDSLQIKQWDHSYRPNSNTIASNTIQLTACPVFVRTKKAVPGNSNNNPGGGNEEEASNEFRFSCYPNPFVDSTQLIFQIKDTRTISLAVYNSNGQLVQQFYDQEQLEAGVYQDHFSGRLPAGVYLCKLEVNENVYTTKIIKVQGE